ncbi:MAG: PKD domain-containing protein, partial [Acidimicrobiales bacterium]
MGDERVKRRLARFWITVLVVPLVVAAVAVQTAGVASAAGNPAAPTLNGVNYSNYGTSLFFTPPSELTGTAITSYQYEISHNGGSTVLVGPVSTQTYLNNYGNGSSPTASPYTDPIGREYCPDGTTCWYRIEAVYDGGASTSPWSTWVTETPFGSAPTLKSVSYSNNGTTLFFTAPTLSTGLTITSYQYEISHNGGATVLVGPFSTQTYLNDYGNGSSPTASPYTDPIGRDYCPDGTTCSYRIRAIIGTGATQSAWSAWVGEGLPTGISADPTSGPAPFATSFTLTLGDPSGSPVHYSVSFGDGSSTSGEVSSPYASVKIDHTYSTAGTFTVGVYTSDSSDTRGSAILQVTATGTIPLTADAGGDQTVTAGVPTTFDASGSHPSTSITSYHWDFGDGNTGSGESIQHTYSTPGTYTATLTVGTAAGQHASAQATVVVVAPPAPGKGLTVTVTDGSSPLRGASIAVITANGTRFSAT